MKHWIIVADAGSCRVFESDERLEEFLPIHSVTNPDARLHAEDLVTHRRGRTRERDDTPRSAFDPKTSPHEAVVMRFAREIAAFVDLGQVEGAYERLVLAAPPRFLGRLRSLIAHGTAEALVASIAHDFTQVPTRYLPDRIRSHLAATAGM